MYSRIRKRYCYDIEYGGSFWMSISVHGYVNLIAAQCLQTGKVYYELSNEEVRQVS